MQCIIKKGMSVIQQIKLIVSRGLHFGKPFHGDDRLLLQIDDDGVAANVNVNNTPSQFSEIRRYRNDMMMISRVMMPLQSRVRRIRTF